MADPGVKPTFWQMYRVPLLLGGAGIVVVITSLILLIKTVQTAAPIEFSPSASSGQAASGSGQAASLITIDIEGAVVSPGVYQLPRESRVEDAIVAAGGLAADADSERIAATINRAAKVVDGGKLYFPRQGERQGASLSGSGQDSSGVTRVASVSINSASQAELEALPGIGPVTAKKIIDNRPYQTLEELLAKKILSATLYEKLKDELTL
ncbi:hypothetical protein A3A64_02780 [Candidatus Gottesmanbacteria bacterium RIFCSPLOWO2_01_FULL_48_11]|uniref:Soluble ligand binding domain-containing protein n=1 Tax=Candidatus Gottesmanbacteria bacterium RIFCSPLOWO2_01_FULL_48_11 TaxID=1798395 RepID=A0A1F6ASA4_9BACT|nr:MAG: hypothetical protein A3A64_02780 [Candidatus Gottesmanbacteria bacterium RIFCSPLOWO2_01_FULL_48_11]